VDLDFLVYGPNTSQVFLILRAQAKIIAKIVAKTEAKAVGQL
jgi:hypothetical protein